MICLYMNSQMKYLKKIAAGNPLIHVDTTYSLSNMFAMVTTIRATEFVGDPIIIGPILLTTRQRQHDFRVLWHEIAHQVPEVMQANLTFVTDGDQALTKSISEAFPLAHLFRCTLHIRDNVKNKASDCNIAPQLIKQISRDTNNMFSFSGYNFHESCNSVFDSWRNSAQAINCSAQVEKFITSYFQKAVMRVIYENINERVKGAGHEDMSMTNNCAESMNAMLKAWCGTNNTIDELCLKLKKGTSMLYEEMDKGHLQLSQRFILKSKPDTTPAIDAMSKDTTQFLPIPGSVLDETLPVIDDRLV